MFVNHFSQHRASIGRFVVNHLEMNLVQRNQQILLTISQVCCLQRGFDDVIFKVKISESVHRYEAIR